MLGLVPGLVLSLHRQRPGWTVPAAAMACAGVLLNRYVMTMQTLSLPTLAFDGFQLYLPSWQELAAFGGVLAYGVLVYSASFRYLPLYPQERHLQSDIGENRYASVGL